MSAMSSWAGYGSLDYGGAAWTLYLQIVIFRMMLIVDQLLRATMKCSGVHPYSVEQSYVQRAQRGVRYVTQSLRKQRTVASVAVDARQRCQCLVSGVPSYLPVSSY